METWTFDEAADQFTEHYKYCYSRRQFYLPLEVFSRVVFDARFPAAEFNKAVQVIKNTEAEGVVWIPKGFVFNDEEKAAIKRLAVMYEGMTKGTVKAQGTIETIYEGAQIGDLKLLQDACLPTCAIVELMELHPDWTLTKTIAWLCDGLVNFNEIGDKLLEGLKENLNGKVD